MLTKSFFRLSLGAAFLAAIILPLPAIAQDAPTSIDPGAVIQELVDERRPVRREVPIILTEEDVDIDDVSTEKIFTLTNVILTGSTIYEAEDIAPLYAEFIGQEVSFADLTRIQRRITRQYREDGYLFSSAVLPPQEIENGIVYFGALEGRISRVRIVGEYRDGFCLIYCMARKIESAGPAMASTIERYLLLIDDLPGIRARSVIQPADETGSAELVVTIEQDLFEGAVGIDNRGSRFLGRWRATGVAAFNSFFGIHDRTTIRGINTVGSGEWKELRFADITHEQQIGTEGVRAQGRFAITRTEPGGRISDLEIKGDSELYSGQLLYPYIRSREFNVNFRGGLTVLNSKSSIGGIQITKDRVRYLTLGTEIDFTDTFGGVSVLDLELAQGLDVLGATDDGQGRSRVDGKHEFTRVQGTATRLQNLPDQFSLLGSVSGQYAWDPMLSSEKFSLGGGNFGRAYDAGEVTGDHGLAAMLELRYGGPVAHDFVHDYQVYGYYDIGKIWNRGTAVGQERNASLASAGLGLRFNLIHDISGYLEAGFPLTRGVAAEGDSDRARVFFNLLNRF